MEPVSQNPVENNMSYQVVYEREDGSSAVDSFNSLDAAVATAERLKNDYAIERPRIFETHEIRYDFQPYFRIQVVDDASAEVVGTTAVAGSTTTMAGGAVAGGAVAGDAVAGGSPFATGETSEYKRYGADGYGAEVAEVDDYELANTGGQEVGGDLGTFDQLDTPDPGLPDVDAGMPNVPDADLPNVQTGLPDVDASMPNPDLPNVPDADAGMPTLDAPDPDIDLTSTGAGAAEGKKPGLFSKFVDSLDGGSGSGADNVIDDLGSATDPGSNRGLFGR